MSQSAPDLSEISCRRKRTRPPPGILVHFASNLPLRDCGKLRNVPLTSPARTLIDLAGSVGLREAEQALHHAIVDRRVTVRCLHARLRDAARQGARGPAVLRRLLQDGVARPHSPLERRVAEVLGDPSLPPFRREHPVYLDGGVYYLDFAWPHFRVGVEADSRRWHSDPSSFESDRIRHNALAAAGWKVLRVTERQVRGEPAALQERVRGLLVRG